jgi:hypothetical protein
MSTRTVIEINHDYIGNLRMLGDLHALIRELAGSSVTGALNKHGRRYEYAPGIRILGQRHHSEPEWKQEADDTNA